MISIITILKIATGYMIAGFLIAYVLRFMMGKFEWANVFTWPWVLFQAFMYKMLG